MQWDQAKWRAAMDADNAWSAELQRQFGKRAGDVRYTSVGEGAKGSTLRTLYDAFRATTDAWTASIQH